MSPSHWEICGDEIPWHTHWLHHSMQSIVLLSRVQGFVCVCATAEVYSWMGYISRSFVSLLSAVVTMDIVLAKSDWVCRQYNDLWYTELKVWKKIFKGCMFYFPPYVSLFFPLFTPLAFSPPHYNVSTRRLHELSLLDWERAQFCCLVCGLPAPWKLLANLKEAVAVWLVEFSCATSSLKKAVADLHGYSQ